jgi:hypothetical protein
MQRAMASSRAERERRQVIHADGEFQRRKSWRMQPK